MTGENDQKQQHDRFIEAAHVAGADENEAAFKAKLAVIAQQQPKAKPTPAKPKKRKAG